MMSTATAAVPSDRTKRGLPILAWSVAVASIGRVFFVLVEAGIHGAVGKVYGPSITFAPSMAIVGGLIASRLPRHVIGWLVLFIAFSQGLVEAASVYAHLPSAGANRRHR
jgi:hypothetical protein